MNHLRLIWNKLKDVLKPRSGLTVRYMFPVIFGLVAMWGASAITSVDSSYIILKPSKTMVMEGESFVVEIYAYAHVPVNAIDLNLSFDPNSVSITSVDKAQSVLTIWTKEPTILTDSISLSGGTYRRGFLGEHLVATIKVVAKGSGQTTISLKGAQLLAGDGRGTPVKISSQTESSTKSFVIYNQNEDPAKISASLDLAVEADLDGDGAVTIKDISAFMSAWYAGSGTYDFNNDSKMNFIDFSIILAKSFLNSAS